MATSQLVGFPKIMVPRPFKVPPAVEESNYLDSCYYDPSEHIDVY